MTLEPSAEALAFVDAMGRGKPTNLRREWLAKCLDAFAQQARDRALEQAAQVALAERLTGAPPPARESNEYNVDNITIENVEIYDVYDINKPAPPPPSAVEAAAACVPGLVDRFGWIPNIAAALTAAERRGYDAALELLASTGTFHDAVRLLDANRPKEAK